MPNHGYCRNCWWWKEIFAIGIVSSLKRKGQCWMHCGDNIPYSVKEEDSYCPDYYNRKRGDKEDGTLDDWIRNIPRI